MKISTDIINRTKGLGIRVVGEGVETEEQLSLLRELRCDAMQGYYFSKPLPANEFAQLVREGRSLPISD